MGRRKGKVPMIPIADENLRRSTFKRKVITVKMMCRQLHTLCDVDAAVIFFDPDGGAAVASWPEDPSELRRIVTQYRSVPGNQGRVMERSIFLREEEEPAPAVGVEPPRPAPAAAHLRSRGKEEEFPQLLSPLKVEEENLHGLQLLDPIAFRSFDGGDLAPGFSTAVEFQPPHPSLLLRKEEENLHGLQFLDPIAFRSFDGSGDAHHGLRESGDLELPPPQPSLLPEEEENLHGRDFLDPNASHSFTGSNDFCAADRELQESILVLLAEEFNNAVVGSQSDTAETSFSGFLAAVIAELEKPSSTSPSDFVSDPETNFSFLPHVGGGGGDSGRENQNGGGDGNL